MLMATGALQPLWEKKKVLPFCIFFHLKLSRHELHEPFGVPEGLGSGPPLGAVEDQLLSILGHGAILLIFDIQMLRV